jgi:hypothetical protein
LNKILIISFSEVLNDPRVYRQVRLLRSHFHVVAAGFGDCPVEGIEWIQLRQPNRTRFDQLINLVLLGLGLFEKSYWNRSLHRIALNLLEGREFDLVLANDIDVLPLVFRIATNTPVILDAH